MKATSVDCLLAVGSAVVESFFLISSLERRSSVCVIESFFLVSSLRPSLRTSRHRIVFLFALMFFLLFDFRTTLGNVFFKDEIVTS